MARSGVRSKLRILVLQCLLGVYPQTARQRNGGKEHLPNGSLPVGFVGVLGFAGSVRLGVGVSLYSHPAARSTLLQLGGAHQGGQRQGDAFQIVLQGHATLFYIFERIPVFYAGIAPKNMRVAFD